MSGKRKDETSEKLNKRITRRTYVVMTLCGIVAFIVLAVQLYKIMIVQHDEYERLAVESQTRETVVQASRGDITDRNGNVLAISATAYTVFISPYEMEKYEEDASAIASGLESILGVEYDTIMEKWKDSKSWYKTVAKKIDAETADRVRELKKTGDYKSVHIETDSKRYYPYSTLAAQVIGFVGSDNNGLEGLESTLNGYLTGENGSIVRLATSEGTDMLLSDYEYYRDAVDGCDVELTLDVTIQGIVEKYLARAVESYQARNGGYAIVMNPNTGEIYAMAVNGSYDLNDYQKISDAKQAEIDEIEDDAERAEALAAAQRYQWRNRAITDTYEPGSVFKTITLAIALEEGKADLDSTYYCGGRMNVLGRKIPLNCWKTAGHGQQTLTQAAQHSCNVAFTNIGLSVGASSFYKYIEAFGLFDKTGIDIAGEAGSLWWSKDVFCNPKNYSQLAAASFGQTFNVTPIQMITAFSAAVNGGNLMKPYVVSKITDGNGGAVVENSPTVVRKVISEDTSKTVCRILEQVVGGAEGTGKNAAVTGYKVGGKTGTSTDTTKQAATDTKEYKVSFCAVAPTDDPQVVVLVILDNPSKSTGIYISGGVMAAPVVGSILSEVLPYLGVEPTYSAEEEAKLDVFVPSLVGKTVEEAQLLLKERGLDARIVGEGSEVTDQLPRPNAEVTAESSVIVYVGTEKPTDDVTVPDLKGMTVSRARNALQNSGLYLDTSGASPANPNAVVSTQNVPAGEAAAYGSVIEVVLADQSNLGAY